MRIAFVGKGGSGKTTCTAFFSQYVFGHTSGNVWAVDADLNMHLAEQLGVDIAGLKHISSPDATKDIKNYLKGDNDKIKELSHFKKTTPPGTGSNFIVVKDPENYIFQNYTKRSDKLFVSVVGTYETPNIGASCYHNNLSVLEIMLSHTIDEQAFLVVDMVAGVDAFAGSLHAQFDLIVLVVEPTKKSMEVYDQYKGLAEAAGIWEEVVVIGNKMTSQADIDFVNANIDPDKLIGSLPDSDAVRKAERGEAVLSFEQLDHQAREVFVSVYNRLKNGDISFNKRLKKLYSLHKKYASQRHIKDRFGDLAQQIDPDFNFDELVESYK